MLPAMNGCGQDVEVLVGEVVPHLVDVLRSVQAPPRCDLEKHGERVLYYKTLWWRVNNTLFGTM